MKEIFDLDIREMFLKRGSSPRLLRFIYAEMDSAVLVCFEEDIDDSKTRKILKTLKPGDIFESRERGMRGFIVEADPCDQLGLIAEIVYKLQEFREHFPGNRQ
jgi:hypothetical protein